MISTPTKFYCTSALLSWRLLDQPTAALRLLIVAFSSFGPNLGIDCETTSRSVPANHSEGFRWQLLPWFLAKNCEVFSPFLFRQVCLSPRGKQLASGFLSRRPQFREEAAITIAVENDLTVRTRRTA
jgi:hypothetical protein